MVRTVTRFPSEGSQRSSSLPDPKIPPVQTGSLITSPSPGTSLVLPCLSHSPRSDGRPSGSGPHPSTVTQTTYSPWGFTPTGRPSVCRSTDRSPLRGSGSSQGRPEFLTLGPSTGLPPVSETLSGQRLGSRQLRTVDPVFGSFVLVR